MLTLASQLRGNLHDARRRYMDNSMDGGPNEVWPNEECLRFIKGTAEVSD